MSYLGNPLVSMNYPVDYFTGNGTTTTLDSNWVSNMLSDYGSINIKRL